MGLRTRPVHALLTQPGFERYAAIAYVSGKSSTWPLPRCSSLLRILGVWFLLLAMVAAVVDGTKTLAGGGQLVVTPLGDQWLALSPDEPFSRQGRGRHPCWRRRCGTRVIAHVLQAPTWLVFGLIGVRLFWLGRKRRPVEVFIN